MEDSGTFTAVDGCRITWRCDGAQAAPALVLSNSLGANLAMWDRQISALTRHFRVVRYDQRGHGASAVPQAEASIERLGRDVLELLDHLKIDRAHFCGVSLGGMTGQWLASFAPERLCKLMLCFTAPYMGPAQAWQDRIDLVRREGIEAIADAVVARWLTPTYAAGHPECLAWMREMVASTDPAGYAVCCAAIRDLDLRPVIRSIEVPVAVICGAHDPATPPEQGQSLAAEIPGAVLEVLPGAHLANVESSAAFNGFALEFLTAQP